MEKQCFASGCTTRITVACSCTNPKTYSCNDHYVWHLRTPVSHVPESLIIELSSVQRNSLLPKLRELLPYLQQYEMNIIRKGNDLIEFVAIQINKELARAKELERATFELLIGRGINKDDYQIINSFNFQPSPDVSDSVENIKMSIERIFKFSDSEASWKESNEIIFSRDQNRGLVSIDLNNFTLSTFGWAPKIGAYGHACKIDRNSYFFYGGLYDGNCYGASSEKSYLINFSEKKYEALPNGICKRAGGICLKEDIVYIFGGRSGTDNVKSCEAFDLKLKQWKPINALPKSCTHITAAVLNKEIILSGRQFNCCYSYNNSIFTRILPLPESYHKLVCEGWIFANSILYENKESNNQKWVSQNINHPWNSVLFTYTSCKKRQFFYFIDNSNSLIRIDTNLKKLEQIAFN